MQRVDLHAPAGGAIEKDNIRSRVEFEPLNLSEPWNTIPAMDFILIRNVLIYFDVPVKKQILAQARGVMQSDGYLFLGCAESTINLDDNFEWVTHEKASCYRLKE